MSVDLNSSSLPRTSTDPDIAEQTSQDLVVSFIYSFSFVLLSQKIVIEMCDTLFFGEKKACIMQAFFLHHELALKHENNSVYFIA